MSGGEKVLACLFICIAVVVVGCTWAWAWQRAQGFALGYEERIVPCNTTISNETVWVKRSTQTGIEIQK